MDHYEKSVSESGSIYGFTALGSTMVIGASTYAAVRGFPKKNAGEDFYMLNKIRKLAHIKAVAGTPIEIPDELAQSGFDQQGHELAGWFQFQTWWEELLRDEPEFLE